MDYSNSTTFLNPTSTAHGPPQSEEACLWCVSFTCKLKLNINKINYVHQQNNDVNKCIYDYLNNYLYSSIINVNKCTINVNECRPITNVNKCTIIVNRCIISDVQGVSKNMSRL